MEENKGFDNGAFYQALETVVQLRRKTWKQVAQDTGVSGSRRRTGTPTDRWGIDHTVQRADRARP